jgi:hypothetical protein
MRTERIVLRTKLLKERKDFRSAERTLHNVIRNLIDENIKLKAGTAITPDTPPAVVERLKENHG